MKNCDCWLPVKVLAVALSLGGGTIALQGQSSSGDSQQSDAVASPANAG